MYLVTVSSQRLVRFPVISSRNMIYSGRATQVGQFRTESQRPKASFCDAKMESRVVSSFA